MKQREVGLPILVVIMVALIGSALVSSTSNYIDLQNQMMDLQSRYDKLSNDYQALKYSQVIKINLEETDVRPYNGTPYLHVRSIVVNFGNDNAIDCRLHVILYQGRVVAKETDIILGSISGRNWVAVDEKVYYIGGPLSNFSVTPTWTVLYVD